MQKELIDNNLILKLCFDFSLAVIIYCETLDEHKKFIISRQLLRSATSIGANAMEAQNAESKADFVHKIKIAAKEADEAQYWLLLCEHAKTYPDCKTLLMMLENIQKVLNKILGTAKKNFIPLITCFLSSNFLLNLCYYIIRSAHYQIS